MTPKDRYYSILAAFAVLIMIAGGGGLALTSCQTTPKQRQDAAAFFGRTAQIAADLAIQIVLVKAQSDRDMADKGNLLDSAAHGLRTLQGATDGLVPPALVVETVRQFTNPAKSHWGDYARELAATYEKAPSDATLEALAMGAHEAAAHARNPNPLPEKESGKQESRK